MCTDFSNFNIGSISKRFNENFGRYDTKRSLCTHKNSVYTLSALA